MGSGIAGFAGEPGAGTVVKALGCRYRDAGLEGALEFAVTDVRWRPHDRHEDLCGHAAIRAYSVQLEAAGFRFELFPYVFEPIGETILVAGVLRVRSADRWRDIRRWWLHEVREDRISTLRGYSSREDALAAALASRDP